MNFQDLPNEIADKVTSLHIIAFRDFKKNYQNKVKHIEVLSPNIKFKKCKTRQYWKDPQLVEMEAEFSVSSPIHKEVWEKIASHIADHFVMTSDNDFTAFEHFESVDALKKGNGSCFAVLNVPNNFIAHSESSHNQPMTADRDAATYPHS